jgi:D-alanyl-lipoteichoic acid acyltransferase DltB (MBOAT superfamily)
MTLPEIFLMAGVALAIGLFPRLRKWSLLVASVTALYALQPRLVIRNLDFWLPTASLGLICIVWAAGRSRYPAEAMAGETAGGHPGIHRWRSRFTREDILTVLLLASILLLFGLTRGWETWGLTASPAPGLPVILSGLCILGIIFVLFLAFSGRRAGALLGAILLLALFLILKSSGLSLAMAAFLRSLTGQNINLASGDEIRWLGFSYIAFRLLHVLRDGAAGRLSPMTLRELMVYTVFFPVIPAGPIDRVQRFLPELRGGASGAETVPVLPAADAWEGGRRIAVGLVKKFILADTLGLIALSNANAGQISSPGWLWFFLYAYALRIYLDFSGYTDIAIGLGRWMGFRLPENFRRPYLQTNLTQFWNSWHITLAQWFRAYFFNPVTRALRSRGRALPMSLIILIGQMGTMLLIGLWHGVTANFALWGLWHGAGLFVHNRWNDLTRARMAVWEEQHPRLRKAYSALATVATFQFVVLGWVWFALPEPSVSVRMLAQLFGLPGGGG